MRGCGLCSSLLRIEAFAGRVSARRPRYFLLLRQRKVPKRKASRSPGRCAVPCAARVWRGRAELAFGSDNARPDPPATVLLSPATRQESGSESESESGTPSPESAHPTENAVDLALPVRQRCPLGGDALKARRGGYSCPCRHALASSAGPGGSGLALFERSEFSQTPPGPSNAANPKGSAFGSPFFCLLFFGEAKKSKAAAGPRPGLQQPPKKQTKTAP